jgi:hypothetical protein
VFGHESLLGRIEVARRALVTKKGEVRDEGEGRAELEDGGGELYCLGHWQSLISDGSRRIE